MPKTKSTTPSGIDVSGLFAPIEQRLDAIESLIARTNDLIEKLISIQAHAAGRNAIGDADQLHASPRARTSGRSAGPRRSKLTLHAAISEVLRQAGQPLTTREIAERVRSARLYVPPRSGSPLSAAQVGSRLYHPLYRSQFTRENGRVALSRKKKGVAGAPR